MFRKLGRRQLLFDIAAPTGLFLLLVGPYSSEPMTLPVLFGMCACLVFWRLNAGISLSIAWITAIGQIGVGLPPNPANLAIPVVLYATAAYGSRLVKWAGFVSSFVGSAVISTYLVVVPTLGDTTVYAGYNGLADIIRGLAVSFFPFLVLFLLAWTLGLLAKTYTRARESRAAQAEAEAERRQAEQDVVIEQERNRIARDMHDIVAHSLAVVIAQSDGARYARASDPAAVDDALTTISTTAREALGDVRVLLSQLRHSQGDVPQPTLDDLHRLLEQLRASGLTIDHGVNGQARPLGVAQQLAVYRIVQESLTNALRHGDTSGRVALTLTWTDESVTITVANETKGERPIPPRPGHGLAGMRERAVLLGGSFSAEQSTDLFVVTACIPRVSGTTGASPVIVAESAR